MPGITVRPVRSSTRAPAGIVTAPAPPTLVMRSPVITIVCPSRGAAPVPSITRALVSTTTGASTLTYCFTPGESCRSCAPSPAIGRSPARTMRRMCFMTGPGGGVAGRAGARPEVA